MLNERDAQSTMQSAFELEKETLKLMMVSLQALASNVAELTREVQRLREEMKEKEAREQKEPEKEEVDSQESSQPVLKDETPTIVPEVLSGSESSPVKPEPQQANTVPALRVVADLLEEPQWLAEEAGGQKFTGLDRVIAGAKQIAQSVASRLSEGISRLTGRDRSLASDLSRQHAVSLLARRVLELSGHERSDGSALARGSFYEFERDPSGGITIRDVSKSERGVIFSVKDGVLSDRLNNRDLESFVKAARTVEQLSRPEAVERA
jgi:hypothetical protein